MTTLEDSIVNYKTVWEVHNTHYFVCLSVCLFEERDTFCGVKDLGTKLNNKHFHWRLIIINNAL